jgi:FtsZ-binding cell division protein ZapB
MTAQDFLEDLQTANIELQQEVSDLKSRIGSLQFDRDVFDQLHEYATSLRLEVDRLGERNKVLEQENSELSELRILAQAIRQWREDRYPHPGSFTTASIEDMDLVTAFDTCRISKV